MGVLLLLVSNRLTDLCGKSTKFCGQLVEIGRHQGLLDLARVMAVSRRPGRCSLRCLFQLVKCLDVRCFSRLVQS